MTNNNDNIPTLHFPKEITDLLTLISEQQTAQIRLCRTLLAGFKATDERDVYYMDHLMDPLMDFMDQGDETEDLYRDYLAHIASFDAQEGQKRLEVLEEHLGYWAKTVYTAAHVAKQLHDGQQDENGADYFKVHVYKVGSSLFSWKQQVAGFLHAAAEDGLYTITELLDLVKRQIDIWNQDPDDHSWKYEFDELMPFPGENSLTPSENDWKEISEILECLDELTAQNHEDYLERFRNNINALHVKLKDLEFSPLGTKHQDYKPLMQMLHEYYSKTVL